jgi:hypothetical protein
MSSVFAVLSSKGIKTSARFGSRTHKKQSFMSYIPCEKVQRLLACLYQETAVPIKVLITIETKGEIGLHSALEEESDSKRAHSKCVPLVLVLESMGGCSTRGFVHVALLAFMLSQVQLFWL